MLPHFLHRLYARDLTKQKSLLVVEKPQYQSCLLNKINISNPLNQYHCFFAPKRLANKADIIFASSSLLNERNTSTLSLCSSKSKFWSEASPLNTNVFGNFSAKACALFESRSISFTVQEFSKRFATPKQHFLHQQSLLAYKVSPNVVTLPLPP